MEIRIGNNMASSVAGDGGELYPSHWPVNQKAE